MFDDSKLICAEVLLDDALNKPLDYLIPSHLSVQPGMRALVPVRGALRSATIIYLKSHSPFPHLLPIRELLSEKPLISDDLLKLAHWMAKYYCAPLRKVLRAFLPPSVRKGLKEKVQLFIRSECSANELKEECEKLRGKHPLQAQILDVLLKNPKGILLTQLLEQAKTSQSPLNTLIKKKILSRQPVQIDRSPLGDDQEYFQTKRKILTPEQTETLQHIQTCLNDSRFETHLIHGVTGSGKTEIYLQAIEHALTLKKGAILLVPEIALTAQTIERLRSRFREKIAILHHRLSHGERHDTWQKLHRGEVQIVVGARSAILSPVANLGLIIVDEEHEGSYKQSDEAPCYHARDVAVMRGKLTNATVILGSATPSLESYTNAKLGKYSLHCLTLRADQALMPKVALIDMKPEFAKAKGFCLFSESLLSAIEKRVKLGEQTLLFLNRRGYHTAQQCTFCSHTMQCPHCDVSLTYHLGDHLLACHLCDYRLTPPRSCPNCHQEGQLKFKGAGTEMVERALHAILPDVRTLRMDADTTRHKGSHDRLFKQFRAGKADVLIGTQMIAKGLHFPSVTLVGILNIDSGLNIPDFRASETVFQLIVQVAGRAGRGALPGEVLIQTHLSDHPTIQHAAAQDLDAFFASELEVRKLFGYPPFSHLAKITFSGESSSATEQFAKDFREQLISLLPSSYLINPVIPCGHARVKDRFRFQLLIKGEKMTQLHSLINKAEQSLKTPKGITYLIDIDPLFTFF